MENETSSTYLSIASADERGFEPHDALLQHHVDDSQQRRLAQTGVPQSSSSLLSSATEDAPSLYSFSSSVPTHQRVAVRSEVRAVMADAMRHTTLEEEDEQSQHRGLDTSATPSLAGDSQHGAAGVVAASEELRRNSSSCALEVNLSAENVPPTAAAQSSVVDEEIGGAGSGEASIDKNDSSPRRAACSLVDCSDSNSQSDADRLAEGSPVPEVLCGDVTEPVGGESNDEQQEGQSATSLAAPQNAQGGGPTPRKIGAVVSITTPTQISTVGISPTGSMCAAHDLGRRSSLNALLSPTATRPAARLPPLDQQLNEDQTDEVAVRRRIEQLSSDLATRLANTPSRSPSRNASFLGGQCTTTTMSFGSNPRELSSSGGGGVANGIDRRKMRDGLIAMSTEARKEDVRTILCKREIKLTELLDEQLTLQRKLESLTNDIAGLTTQKAALETLRHTHHADMIHLRSEVSALNKQLNGLSWDEGRLHQEITDLTSSLQRFRHKRSTEEIKRLQELNSVNYELSIVEKSIHEETSNYKNEWQRLRAELRAIQEETVTFNPQEWLAAAVAAGMKKKIAAVEFGGNTQKAHQYATATLGGLGRRKTVANIEDGRSALDSFLQGS